MEYRTLGKSDLNISGISMGCMSLPADKSQAVALLHQALDLGINFFDTADIYGDGENEKIIAEAFRDVRSRVIIASKAGNVRRPDGGLDWNPSKNHILNSVEGSLRRLQTDYIDLYQLHGGTINDNVDETIEAFEMLKQQGKIRWYGISSIRPNVISTYIKKSSIVSVMMQYSLLDRRPEETCLDLLRENDIGVLVRGSLAQGLLVNKPARSYLEPSANEVHDAAMAVDSVSRGGRNATQTAIRYVLRHPAITSAVVGVRTSEQLQEAVKTSASPPLADTDIEVLRNSIRQITYKDHR